LAGFAVTGGGGIAAPPEEALAAVARHKAAPHSAAKTVRDWGKRRITTLNLRLFAYGVS
jgi:hypothetical protein